MHNIRKGCCIYRKYLRTWHIYIQQTKAFCDYAITPYSKNMFTVSSWALVSMISYFVDPFHVLRMPVFVRSMSLSHEVWFMNEIIMKISKTIFLSWKRVAFYAVWLLWLSTVSVLLLNLVILFYHKHHYKRDWAIYRLLHKIFQLTWRYMRIRTSLYDDKGTIACFHEVWNYGNTK